MVPEQDSILNWAQLQPFTLHCVNMMSNFDRDIMLLWHIVTNMIMLVN